MGVGKGLHNLNNSYGCVDMVNTYYSFAMCTIAMVHAACYNCPITKISTFDCSAYYVGMAIADLLCYFTENNAA